MRLPHLALVCALALGSVSCSSGDDQPAEAARSGGEKAQSKILQPGRPGEDMETLPPDTTVSHAPANDADVMFMQMMVPHHAQALEMSELAETRAQDDQVVALARRIEGSQGPEITAMMGWLQSRGMEVPESVDDLEGHSMGHGGDHGGDHGSDHGDGMVMQGMLTERQMDRLAAARGTAFDRLFLESMIRHHEGAVTMARDLLGSGSEALAIELAADVALGQEAEIGRMVEIEQQL